MDAFKLIRQRQKDDDEKEVKKKVATPKSELLNWASSYKKPEPIKQEPIKQEPAKKNIFQKGFDFIKSIPDKFKKKRGEFEEKPTPELDKFLQTPFSSTSLPNSQKNIFDTKIKEDKERDYSAQLTSQARQQVPSIRESFEKTGPLARDFMKSVDRSKPLAEGGTQKLTLKDELVRALTSKKYLPFLDVLETPKLVNLATASYKLMKGDEISQEEVQSLQEYMNEQNRDRTFGNKVAQITLGSFKLGAEIVLFNALGIKKKVTEEGAKRSLKWLLSKKGFESVTGAVARKTPQMIATTLPKIPQATLEKQINANLGGEGEDWGKSITKATIENAVDFYAEFSGGVVGDVLGSVTKPVANKLLKKSWVEAFKKLNPKYAPRVNKFFKEIAYDGVINEMLEERVGEVTLGLLEKIGLSDKEFKKPTVEDLAVEITSFAIPGVGGKVASSIINFSAEDLKNNVDGSDLNGTPAGDNLTNMANKAEETGRDIKVDVTGKKGTKIVTPDGNTIGVELGEKKAKIEEKPVITLEEEAVKQPKTGVKEEPKAPVIQKTKLSDDIAKAKASGQSFDEWVKGQENEIGDKLYALNKKAKEGRASVSVTEDTGEYGEQLLSFRRVDATPKTDRLYKIKDKLVKKIGTPTGDIHFFPPRYVTEGYKIGDNYFHLPSSFKEMETKLAKKATKRVNEKYGKDIRALENKYNAPKGSIGIFARQLVSGDTPMASMRVGLYFNESSYPKINKLKKIIYPNGQPLDRYIMSNTDRLRYEDTFSKLIDEREKLSEFKKEINELSEKIIRPESQSLSFDKVFSDGISKENVKNIPLTESDISYLDKLANEPVEFRSQLKAEWDKTPLHSEILKPKTQPKDIYNKANKPEIKISKESKQIIEQLGEPKRTDPACIKEFRKVQEANPDKTVEPLRGIFSTDLSKAYDQHQEFIKRGQQKQLGGYGHIMAKVNGKIVDDNFTPMKGAEFFSEDQIQEFGKNKKEVKKTVIEIEKEPLIKENFSKHYEKMKEMHPELKGHQIFDRMEIKDKREKAFNYVNKNPEKAMRIGYELEDAPLEQDVNAIRHVLVQILKDGGKIKEAQDISKLASSEFTKAAQDLNIAKLDFLDESQILKNLNDARLEKLGKQLGEADLTKAKEKAKEHIKEKAKNQSKKINEQTKENIKEKMNEYINSIIC